MLKIGITGGIGVGKTIVCRMFQVLGIPVYDADTRAKWVMQYDLALKQELRDAFGEETYTPAGDLNRTYLASIVFNNPDRLNRLNALVHPHVGTDFEKWVAAHPNAPYVIKEAALMFESESWRQMDEIIVVSAPLNVRLKRLLKRDTHRTEADIKAIISKQLSEEEKIARANHVVFNDDKQLLIPQVLALHQQFLSR
ncbi:dephospho-CoA kinase [Pontibacter sp. JH31]|uniref:Dephospho-CoA kinase n=1 Tax=Pontibacter aquaedesilientis TaxID=2766980 RepID=A0ABR7XL23_9BACT|nr:dephospho-CoA kinase [Pontibacter aquaedesilientis]MBD1398975.1 dephospho-CoA kinase [Pontibacter aquaedesilientis]